MGVVETVVGGKAYRSPDHYMNGRLPNYPGDASFEARRSGGFEPMAKSLDGKTLYPMFEWPFGTLPPRPKRAATASLTPAFWNWMPPAKLQHPPVEIRV